ncbi:MULTISPECIES: hypothetical protein [Bacillus]|nr:MULTISPECIES: hypothetical protein [Bacillus cereus group]KAB0449297.1 hypothetical protein CH334_05125 [Lysinibacillus sp. VIA-II-2016]MBJ8133495.1 hypothetical protein [Bacillus cereus group sp. N3]MDA1876706.1 hypothetical protein [Bacillus cereus group sp. BY112LC]PEB30871.1 hypothetical protein COO14_08195 [Bacillus toyonensis]PEC62571.1 hypothetical protein CON62_29335 [Bacillus toyonensis]
MINQTRHTNSENPEQISSFEGSPCHNPGDEVCRGDVRYVCEGGRWQSTSAYCPDEIPSQSFGQNFSIDDMGPCEGEGSTTCIGDITYKCKNGRWKPTYEYCQGDSTRT